MINNYLAGPGVAGYHAIATGMHVLIRLVAFDCDGVLFDSRQANIAFYNDILAHFRQPSMDSEAENFVHCHTVGESLAYIFRGYPNLDEVQRYCRNFDYSRFIPLMVEEPYLREFLDFLRPACFTALATNRTTTTAAVLNYHQLADRFDLVVSALDVSQPKPHPESFERILRHFGLEPREAIYIGDSEVDQAFAANAGVPLVAYRNPRLMAAFHLESFAAGPDLLRRLNGRQTH
jgi:HAD superfamily hydrolase (TIGR01509 family)